MSIQTQKINGKTKVYAVFGFPIGHSLSPQMHNAAFEYKKMNCVYVAYNVNPKDLKSILKILPQIGISGVNLTIPHKEIAYSCVDYLSKEAKLVKAVNTIKVAGDKLYGYNTDGKGLIKSLKEDANVNLKGKNILLLGAGGAAKGISIPLSQTGINSLIIANRTYNKAKSLAEKINKISRIKCETIPLEESIIKEIIGDIDLVINSTSVGLYKNDRSLLSSKTLHPKLIVYDLVYNPPDTPLMKEARKAGAKAVNGLGMLLYQGVLAWEIWTEHTAPVKIMRNALLTALKKGKNEE